MKRVAHTHPRGPLAEQHTHTLLHAPKKQQGLLSQYDEKRDNTEPSDVCLGEAGGGSKTLNEQKKKEIDLMVSPCAAKLKEEVSTRALMTFVTHRNL